MKNSFLKKFRSPVSVVFLLLTVSSTGLLFMISSFRVHKQTGGDFLQQLGITTDAANEKISSSILGGHVSAYGVKNVKNIAAGNRKALTLDLLASIKQYVAGADFANRYNEMRERYKPEKPSIQTPEEIRVQNIANSKKFVADAEEMLKKANASFKVIFEKSLADARQNVKEAEDPRNKQYVLYSNNYQQLVKDLNAGYERSLADWNKKYPANQMLFVKQRLEQFLEVTKDVDFSADLADRNGKKIFCESGIRAERWPVENGLSGRT